MAWDISIEDILLDELVLMQRSAEQPFAIAALPPAGSLPNAGKAMSLTCRASACGSTEWEPSVTACALKRPLAYNVRSHLRNGEMPPWGCAGAGSASGGGSSSLRRRFLEGCSSSSRRAANIASALSLGHGMR